MTLTFALVLDPDIGVIGVWVDIAQGEAGSGAGIPGGYGDIGMDLGIRFEEDLQQGIKSLIVNC